MSAASAPIIPTRRILGVEFFVGSLETATDRALAGGLVVAPSGPGMAADLVHSPAYRAALTTADLVITDSSWMVLLWRLFTGEKLLRNSGLALMRSVLERPELKKPGAVFWVMPSATERDCNLAWLRAQGFPVSEADTYLAPRYPATGTLSDPDLLAILRQRRPAILMLAIGGGVQERLGHTLRSELDYRPAILCLGAAIAFLTGAQTAIPPWADRLYLGWLIRLVRTPRIFWPRLWKALRLAPLLRRYRDALPELV